MATGAVTFVVGRLSDAWIAGVDFADVRFAGMLAALTLSAVLRGSGRSRVVAVAGLVILVAGSDTVLTAGVYTSEVLLAGLPVDLRLVRSALASGPFCVYAGVDMPWLAGP